MKDEKRTKQAKFNIKVKNFSKTEPLFIKRVIQSNEYKEMR